MSKLYRPAIFEQFPKVVAALSLRDVSQPANYSMLPVQLTTEALAQANRNDLAAQLGFNPTQLIVPREIHGQEVALVETGSPGRISNTDALISNTPGYLLAVTIADCLPILIYDPENKAIAAIHSGWRGTKQNIAALTVTKMASEFGSKPTDLVVWLGPGAGQCHYEVDADVADQFEARYSKKRTDGKFMFDNAKVVLDQLVAAGVLPANIAHDSHCTIHDRAYHSARRDKTVSGRMIAAIGLR